MSGHGTANRSQRSRNRAASPSRPRDSKQIGRIRTGLTMADIVVDAGDRAGLERLCRYLLRPLIQRRRSSISNDVPLSARAVGYQLRQDRFAQVLGSFFWASTISGYAAASSYLVIASETRSTYRGQLYFASAGVPFNWYTIMPRST